MLQIFYVVVKNVLQTEALCYNEESGVDMCAANYFIKRMRLPRILKEKYGIIRL